MRSGYREWLKQQGYGTGTIIAQMHRAGRVEDCHGDIDDHYTKDRMASLIAKLRYSTEDKLLAHPNPSAIPFEGDICNNLASYRFAARQYLKFRDAGSVGIDTSASIVGATPKAAKLSKAVLVDGIASLDAIVRRAGFASIVAAVAEHTIFLDPRTVAQSRGEALFPVIRGVPPGTFVTLQGGQRVMLDDNTTPTVAFLWAAGCSKGKDVQFNHIWTDAKNPRRYTALWNMCATPAFLAKTTDGSNHPEVSAALQYRAYQLYGIHAHELPPSVRPAGFDHLQWAAMPGPVLDLEAVLRKELASKPKHRAAIAAHKIGWLFSGWEPDRSIGG